MKLLFNQMIVKNRVESPKMNNYYAKKGQDQSIHVSDFLTDTIGRLKLNEDDIDNTISHEACVIINPGKNFDGWWNIDQLINQIIII
jgi:hypothetical protein